MEHVAEAVKYMHLNLESQLPPPLQHLEAFKSPALLRHIY